MNKIIIILIILLGGVPVLAQNKDYIEMSKEVDEEVWGDKDAIFSNNKLPAEYKNESAVILARKQIVETNTERKGKSLLYIGKMHSTIKRTIRERIFINDQVSLNEYSEINFIQLQSKQSGAITKLRSYTFMGIQVTKPDGVIQKIDVDENAVKLDETKDGKKNKIAVPNLAIGDVIDYYITYFDQVRTDKDVDFYTFTLGDEYPILNLSIKILLDKRIAAQYQVINGAPDFKISNVDGENLLELSASNLPKSTNVMWTSEARQVPIVRLKYAFANIVHSAGDYTKTGNVEKVTSPNDVEHEFVNLIKNYLAKVSVATNIKSLWKDYVKKQNIDKENVDSLISFIFYYYRESFFNTLYYRSGDAELERFNSADKDLTTIKLLELTLNVMKTINATSDLEAELVLVSSKNDVAYKNIFSIADFNYMLRLPCGKDKFKFYYFGNSLYNLEDIPPSFENEDYKFIQQNTIFRSGRDMSQEKADEVNGRSKTFKTTAEQNNENEDLVVEFDDVNLQLMKVKRKVTAMGHQRRDFQSNILILEDYWAAMQSTLGKISDASTYWNNIKGSKKAWVELENVLSKAKTDQKEKFENEITRQFDKPKELKSYNIISTGLSGANAAIVIEEEFVMDGWVKKAGNNYILEAGKLVGSQLEMKADQRDRKLDIYMPFARSFNYNITIKIPEGYTVEGVEKLNKSVKNECGGFESTAKIEGGNLIITYYKYYSNIFDPVANWSKILAFVDAGFDFTKEKLLFKKK